MKGTSLLLHCWLAISFHFIAGWLFHFISLQAGYFISLPISFHCLFHFIVYFISLPISLQAVYFITGWLLHFHCLFHCRLAISLYCVDVTFDAYITRSCDF